MELGYTLLYVDDVEKTLDFYESAFGLKKRFVNVDGDQAYGELETGATTLGFVSHQLVRSNGVETQRCQTDSPAPPFEIGFVTENVNADFATAVKAGAQAIVQPTDKPWGQRVAYVRDLNGFLVEICTKVDT